MQFISVKLTEQWRRILVNLAQDIYDINKTDLQAFKDATLIVHHMTMAYKPEGDDPICEYAKSNEGKTVKLYITGFGWSDKAWAYSVVTEVPSNNSFKHITIAVSETGSPVDSNNITIKRTWKEKDWIPAEGTIVIE